MTARPGNLPAIMSSQNLSTSCKVPLVRMGCTRPLAVNSRASSTSYNHSRVSDISHDPVGVNTPSESRSRCQQYSTCSKQAGEEARQPLRWYLAAIRRQPWSRPDEAVRDRQRQQGLHITLVGREQDSPPADQEHSPPCSPQRQSIHEPRTS